MRGKEGSLLSSHSDLSPSPSLFFPSLLLRAALHHLNACNACEQKKTARGGVEGESEGTLFPFLSLPPYFFPAILLRATLYYLNAFNRLQPVAKMSRHANEKPAFLSSNLWWSGTSMQCNTHLPPTLHSKLFLQVLSMVLYC